MTRSPSPSNPSEQLQESGSDQSNTERRTFTETVPSTERRTFSEAPPRPTSSRSEGRGGSSRGGGGGMLGAFQDDELLEYAEQQAREEEEEDEDDPLDAFMANIEVLQAFKGGEIDFTFLVLFLRIKKVDYNGPFSGWKRIVPSQSYRVLKSQKYMNLHYPQKLNRDFLIINFKLKLLRFLR